MKKGKKFILIATIAVICILNNVFAAIRKETWTDSSNWEKLQKGMTEEKVARILGEPKQEVRRTSVMWCYQQTPEELNQIPSYGVVVFKKFQDAYTLYSWKEPDWELLQVQLEAEEIAQAKAEEQRIAAENELERQQRLKQAEQEYRAMMKASSERYNIELRTLQDQYLTPEQFHNKATQLHGKHKLLALQMKQDWNQRMTQINEQAAKRTAQTKKNMEELQLKRERERAELRSYKPRGLVARYFLVLGIGFAGAAVVFAIARKRAES